MTRINLEKVELLCQKHLIAEWFEQPRVITLLLKRQGKLGKIPAKFTIQTAENPKGGTGHVTFFYNKLSWLRKRYVALMAEMARRGIKTSDNWNPEIFNPEYAHLFKSWEPTAEAISLSRQRICQMIPEKESFTDKQLCEMVEIAEYSAYIEKVTAC
ncbi:endonuclease V N-glycosylase UV repair enzyme [Aeromonas phage GomatiRiver_11]|nr:endonuclease V [Aeromonas phage AhFM11]WKW84265.1 endonuclease V N-glycosylase UV repair enzyme [Aeromonas phage GomatiRiver_11]